VNWAAVFQEFEQRKTREATNAMVLPLTTIEAGRLAARFPTLGNAWVWLYYGGGFSLLPEPPALPSVTLVFVRSREGNTGASNPEVLGGGATDKHLIYEGVSRVTAHAVLAGAGTIVGPDVFFSVWHPELVALRLALGLPRHPTQIVISNEGHFEIASMLLFNVPTVPVIVLAGPGCLARCASDFAARPWIRVFPFQANDWHGALGFLRTHYQMTRISAIGGRTTAASLLEAGVVTDICLTTTAQSAGEPDSPYYGSAKPPRTLAIIKKAGGPTDARIVFEHLAVI
jgi:riboflavin biosynthesis pyrimidine reductase